MGKGEELNSNVNVILMIRTSEPSFKLQVGSALRRTNVQKRANTLNTCSGDLTREVERAGESFAAVSFEKNHLT